MKTKIAAFILGMAIGLCLIAGVINMIIGFFYADNSWQTVCGLNQVVLAAALTRKD
jgi:hypothetical protein